MSNIEKIVKLLSDHFQDDIKVLKWIITENPNFGGSKPSDLIFSGKSSKVLEFISAEMELNQNLSIGYNQAMRGEGISSEELKQRLRKK